MIIFNNLFRLILFFCIISCDTNTELDATYYEDQDSCDFGYGLSSQEYEIKFKEINASLKMSQLDTLFENRFKKKPLNGCILIHQDGIDLYKKCFGTTCFKCDQKDLLTFQTSFQLASLSKTFTAVAVLKLIEHNKIALSDTIQKFYPDFPYKNITIQSLLNHRSGLPYYAYAFQDSLIKGKIRPNNQDLMKWFEIFKPDLYANPNRHFGYNNTNYAVLAAIIEKISQQSYENYIQKNICEPLGLQNTYSLNHIPKDQIKTIGHEGTRVVPKDYFDDVLGDKGIYSSIDDLYKWYRALNSTCLLNNELLQLAFTPQSFEKKGKRNYGLGFRMIINEDTKEAKYIYHNGWWKGYNTLFWFDPQSKSFVAILSNVKNKSVYKIKPIIEILEQSKSFDKEEDDEE
jgi:CubicO group peptidase (beta-lactamase class C family)